MVKALMRRRRGAVAMAAALLAGTGCGSMEGGEEFGEPIQEAEQELEAHCSVTVNGVGKIDVEKNYLPHVVHCENGGAPFEALKAQAIAARTYLYYRLASVSSMMARPNAIPGHILRPEPNGRKEKSLPLKSTAPSRIASIPRDW